MRVRKTKLMHYLPSVYSVTILLHVSGLLVAHHQEITMCICDNRYVLYALVDLRRAGLEWFDSSQAHRQSTKAYNMYRLSHTHCYILMMGY
jgi:hypothetical protein